MIILFVLFFFSCLSESEHFCQHVSNRAGHSHRDHLLSRQISDWNQTRPRQYHALWHCPSWWSPSHRQVFLSYLYAEAWRWQIAELEEILQRKWMISDSNGKVLIQNQFPKMAVIKQKIVGDHIELSAPDNSSVRFPIDSPNKHVIKCRSESNPFGLALTKIEWN